MPVALGQGDLEEAVKSYTAGLEIAIEYNFILLQAIIRSNMVTLYTNLGEYNRANQELAIVKTLAGVNQIKFVLGNLLIYSGNYYLNLGNYHEAEKLHLQAIDRLKSEQKLGWLCKAYNDVGFVKYLQGKFEKSIEYLGEGLKVSLGIGESRQVAVAYRRLGRVLIGQQNYTEAKDFLKKAMKIHIEMDQPNRALIAVAGLAELALARQDIAQAEDHAEELWQYLQNQPIDWLIESLMVYDAAYKVFCISNDKRAEDLREMARAHLEKRLASIEDETERSQFKSVSIHQQVMGRMGINLPKA